MHLNDEQRRLAAIAARARACAATKGPIERYPRTPFRTTRSSAAPASAEPSAPDGIERRRCGRVPLVSQIAVKPVGGFTCKVRLDDVSTAG